VRNAAESAGLLQMARRRRQESMLKQRRFISTQATAIGLTVTAGTSISHSTALTLTNSTASRFEGFEIRLPEIGCSECFWQNADQGARKA